MAKPSPHVPGLLDQTWRLSYPQPVALASPTTSSEEEHSRPPKLRQSSSASSWFLPSWHGSPSGSSWTWGEKPQTALSWNLPFQPRLSSQQAVETSAVLSRCSDCTWRRASSSSAMTSLAHSHAPSPSTASHSA